MAWIKTIEQDDWDGELAELLPRVVNPADGTLDHIMQIHSLNPAGLAAHDVLYRSAMAGTAKLRRVEREMIALVVSNINSCHY